MRQSLRSECSGRTDTGTIRHDSVIFHITGPGTGVQLCLSRFLLLKTENAFTDLACVEDVPFSDGAGGLSAKVITNGTRSEETEIG